MNDAGVIPVEVSSWAGADGNSDRTRVSPIVITSRGRLLWSSPLPSKTAGGITFGSGGLCFVSSPTNLTALAQNGERVWSVDTRLAPAPTPIAIVGARLLRFEGFDHADSAVVVRDQATGDVVGTLPIGGLAFPYPAPGPRLAATVLSSGKGSLRLLGMDGVEVWRREVDEAAAAPPLVWDSGLALSAGSSINSYDLQGNLAWIAGLNGFRRSAGASQQRESDGPVAGAIARVSDELFVAEIAGVGASSIDVAHETVRPIGASVRGHAPFAIPMLPGGTRSLVGIGPRRAAGYNSWKWTVVAMTLDGVVVWEHSLDTKPAGVIADAAGTVIVWSSPSPDVWAKYRNWYELAGECAVHAIDGQGRHMWTWQVPGPITHPPVIGPRGEVCVGAEGQVWTLG
jgi:hypothetical protein